MARGFCHHVLSEYAVQSHNFPNLNVCEVTLLFSLEIDLDILGNRFVNYDLTKCAASASQGDSHGHRQSNNIHP